mmetsp:Transcript_3356/g.3960  ORF Transcript_3356/g.3960 Transcript_3356/m.3960 type:complete len:161 (+) Transcript_3356:2-484(+)
MKGIHKPSIADSVAVESVEKLHIKRLSNTSDKMNHVEDLNSHKNGTVTGSDHKPFAKRSESKLHEKHIPNPLDNSGSGVQIDRENDKKSNAPEAENDIIFKERKKWYKCHPKAVIIMNKILENNIYIIFMTIVTIYALFGDDFRLLFSPKSGDYIFWSLT